MQSSLYFLKVTLASIRKHTERGQIKLGGRIGSIPSSVEEKGEATGLGVWQDVSVLAFTSVGDCVCVGWLCICG